MKNTILLATMLILLVFKAIGQESKGDLFDGLSKPITENQVIPSYGIEVTFDKTSNLIFPSPIERVDLGSANLVGGKFPGAENILRIKAAVRGFKAETNFSLVTKDGVFYSFNVRYADEPAKLNINIRDLIYDASKGNVNKQVNIYRKELGKSSPRLVELIMRTIYRQDRRIIKDIGAKMFGIQCLLKGIYVHENLLYFYTEIKNTSNINFDIDFIRFKVVDKQVMKRVAIQEISIIPVEVYNNVTVVEGSKRERTVFAFEKFTMPDDKVFLVEIFEKNGGRNYSFKISNSDLMLARSVENLKLQP